MKHIEDITLPNRRNPKVTPSQFERPPSLCLLLSLSDFPSIAISQKDRCPLKIGKGGKRRCIYTGKAEGELVDSEGPNYNNCSV